MANALTTLRLVLVLPFVFVTAKGDSRSAAAALIIWLVALTTDLLDGPIARRRGTVRPISGTLTTLRTFCLSRAGFRRARGVELFRGSCQSASRPHLRNTLSILIGSRASRASRKQTRPA